MSHDSVIRHRSVGRLGLVLLLLLATAVPRVLADGDTIDAAGRGRVVDRLATLIQQNYVDEAEGAAIADDLRHEAAGGAFDGVASARDLAGTLTRRLQQRDRHFRVDWMPADAGRAVAEEHGQDGHDASRRHNHGFRTVERLPGNVGYLDLRYFDSPSVAGDAAAAAMGMLAGADAVVVDLRNNGGGEPEMVQLLCSYFLPAERVHLNDLFWRDSGKTEQFWSSAYVPGRRMPETPLFVLTSARTGSAAEEFAYNLQSLGRAEVVGETTAGAGNPGTMFDAGDGFVVFISTGKAINPVTGTSWEGVGVQPDVPSPADAALDTAWLRALGILAESATDPGQRREIAWARESIEVRVHPRPVEIRDEEFVGTYGDRSVTIESGLLTYRRGRRPSRWLVALGNDRFLLDGVEGFRVRFERDAGGRVVRLVDQWDEGHEEVHARD